MASLLLENFFPDVCSFFQTNLPVVWDFFFPKDIAVQCPRPIENLFGFAVFWPQLIPFGLLGAVTGLLGALLISRRLWIWKCGENKLEEIEIEERERGEKEGERTREKKRR